MRTFDLEDLHILQTVIAHGGVTRAAQLLHRVPSNISTRIKQLEARLGLALFERQGRQIAPTEQGLLLASYAERLLRLASEAEIALQTGQGLGTLRIGALESTAGSRLPALLARYHELHPSIRLELITGTTDALIARLARQDIDAAFVSEPFQAPGMQSQAIFTEELVLISAANHPTLPAPDRKQALTLICFASGCSYRRLLEQWHSEQGYASDYHVLEFASYPAIVSCVAAGTGIAIVPRSVLAGLHASRSVQQHPLPAHLGNNRTFLIQPKAQEPQALQHLRELIRESHPLPA